MTYEIKFKEGLVKELKHLDRQEKIRIFKAIYNKLSINPKQGKPLKGKHQDLWRYRVGSYRVIYTFNDKELWILVLEIDHRKEIYRNY